MAYDESRDVIGVAAGKVWNASAKDMWMFGRGPGIAKQPVSLAPFVNASAKLTVDPISPEPLSIQWRRDGLPLVNGGNIQGATTATLTIDPVNCADAASYDVRLDNECGTKVSEAASLSTPIHSDITLDGVVDQSDLGVLLSAYGICQGQYGWMPAADLNGDGCVGQSDLGVLLNEYGVSCP
jgi:hypothetical protein